MTHVRPVLMQAVMVAAVLAIPTAGLAVAARSAPSLAMINESPSVPKGLYIRSFDQELRPGRIVALAQPAVARPYLAGLGVPSDVRLLKRVAAIGGEDVCIQHGRLHTPHASVGVQTHDRRGGALPTWQGCRKLAAGEVLLLGDTPTSFDGRYFGPIRRAEVEAVYREVLRW